MMLAELHEKAARSAQRSPLTWGAAQVAISSLAATIIGFLAVLAWTDNRYEARDHAVNRPADMTLRQEILAKFDELKAGDLKDIKRTNAWMLVQLARNAADAKVARVNDCNILREKGRLTPMERGACLQYDDELKAAQKRFDEAQSDAIKLSR